MQNGLCLAALICAALPSASADAPDTAAKDIKNAPSAPLPAAPQTAPAMPPPDPGAVRLQKFRHLHWKPDDAQMSTEGSAEVVYTQPDGRSVSTLTARDLDFDLATAQIHALGGFRLNRPEGNFFGQDIDYSLRDDAGTVTKAVVETGFFQMKGAKIELKSNQAVRRKMENPPPLQQTYIVTDGEFTTCGNERPDYRVTSHELTVVEGEYVSAKNITFYLGSTRLLTLPFPYKRSLRRTSGVAAPAPSYNKAEGLTVRFNRRPVEEVHRTLDVDLRVGLRYLPIGFVLYNRDLLPHNPSTLPPLDRSGLLTNPLGGILERLSPPDFQDYTENRFPEELGPRATFYAALQHRQFVFNRNRYNNSRYDLQVSRFPEVGVEFANILGHFPDDPSEEKAVQNVNNTEIALHHIPNAPFLLDAGLSAGVIDENPTHATSGRLALRVSAATQPLLLGKRLSLRAGVTDWANLYTRGTAYNLLMPEIDLNYVPTRTSLLSVGYRYETDIGRTPFLFDRRDLRHELHLRYQVGGPWAFGISTSYNLENFRTFETQIVALRNFDCMQIGVGYRFQAQQFNVIFNLLPPTPNRAARRRAPLEAFDVGPAP